MFGELIQKDISMGFVSYIQQKLFQRGAEMSDLLQEFVWWKITVEF